MDSTFSLFLFSLRYLLPYAISYSVLMFVVLFFVLRLFRFTSLKDGD